MSGPVPLVTPQTVVTAIGTQRILAPLRLISRRTEVRLRTGGFCCSDQSTRLARTRIERLVAREKRIGVASGAPVFIEISSRKTLSLNGRPVGRSFLERRFPDAMQNASLARQILTIAELTGREKRIEALTNRASLYHVLTPADLRELAGYTLETAKEQDMAADLSAIAGLVPSPIIVTPIGADLIDGGLVDESGALKSMLMRCLLQLDIPAFDPTSLVERFGRDLALSGEPDSVGGFTKGFVRMIAAHLAANHLSALEPRSPPLAMDDNYPLPLAASGGS